MRRILILATVIVLVMGAGIAIAQVGDDGVIYACAEEKTGELRLVGSPDDCEKKEVSVSWNQQGLPGLDGADGNIALANQVCEEDGASVIGFDADGDIVCQVGGATTTTTTTTTEPPTPSDEVCNGIDDDLNGSADDGLLYCVSGIAAPNTDGDATCDSGWYDLDGTAWNGCEADHEQCIQDVLFVVDHSGSMDQGLPALAEAVDHLLLSWDLGVDAVQTGLIAFSDTAELVEPFTGTQGVVAAGIDALSPDSGTCLHCGLELAGNHIIDNGRTEAGPAVVLITDGDPNVGNTSITDIAALAASLYNYNGTPTYVVGLQGATMANLNQIASAGGTQSAGYAGPNAGEILGAFEAVFNTVPLACTGP